MTKLATLFLCCLLSQPIYATPEDWTLIWVSPSTKWFVRQGNGELDRSANSLKGTLNDESGDPDFLLSIDIQGSSAKGVFEVLHSDAGPTKFSRGSYAMTRENNQKNCLEMIQLYNGWDYLALSRYSDCKNK